MPVSRKRTKKHRSPSSQASRKRQRKAAQIKRQEKESMMQRAYMNRMAIKMGLEPLF